MSFAWPWLFLALPLPWLLRLLGPPSESGMMLRVPHLPERALQARSGRINVWLAALAWLLLVSAAARPQMPGELLPPPEGIGLVIAFDVSRSMSTVDLQHGKERIARLQAARRVADDFLARREGDRAGLVVFGAQAYLHTPLTRDLRAVRTALATVETDLAGPETALGDAIALSVKYLKTLPESARVLVLLTDGANTAGTLDPARAAWLAQREGVVIHAVGIGAGLEEKALRDIAAQTGGRFALATDSRALADFFDDIARAAPAPGNEGERTMRALYPWPLAFACLLVACLAWQTRREHA